MSSSPKGPPNFLVDKLDSKPKISLPLINWKIISKQTKIDANEQAIKKYFISMIPLSIKNLITKYINKYFKNKIDFTVV